jgi:hypothetical protein
MLDARMRQLYSHFPTEAPMNLHLAIGTLVAGILILAVPRLSMH